MSGLIEMSQDRRGCHREIDERCHRCSTILTVLRAHYSYGVLLIFLAPFALPILTFPADPILHVLGEDENATARSSNMLEMERIRFGQAAVLPHVADARPGTSLPLSSA